MDVQKVNTSNVLTQLILAYHLFRSEFQQNTGL